MDRFNISAEKHLKKINVKKTKKMMVPREEGRTVDITVTGKQVEAITEV